MTTTTIGPVTTDAPDPAAPLTVGDPGAAWRHGFGLRIKLANAQDIRGWSCGEVTTAETMNFRSRRPVRGGLFCERIFGPIDDWRCHCGKYRRRRYEGIICERCGVMVTRASARRQRMGHIELAVPVTHIWFAKALPSPLALLLDITPKDLDTIIYFTGHVITDVYEELRRAELPALRSEMAAARELVEARRDAETQRDLASLKRLWRLFTRLAPGRLVTSDEFAELTNRYGRFFAAASGAEAIRWLLHRLDLDAEAEALREVIRNGKGKNKLRAIKRMKVVAAFQRSGNSPMDMVLDAVPVIPPGLRPMVRLDGVRFATSDLNDLYRRVINRNNRLKKMIEAGVAGRTLVSQKRMLQESVDALFDNGRRGRPVVGPGNRPLRSLSDLLKGKQGRFRQNLLGKRVDYSGRSVIVVGPQLKLHQCGLPKLMALELFKPHVIHGLRAAKLAPDARAAKRMVERRRPQVWDVLDEVIIEHPVLLNRAPTLHRLGIQAFEPMLVEGKAIQLHPLVCEAFNADFDGDQMAVHLPLSAEAQAEARTLMLSSNSILSPASGKPLAMPRLDMVTGLYYLTTMVPGDVGEYRPAGEDAPEYGVYCSPAEAIMAVDRGALSLRAKIKVRLTQLRPPAECEAKLFGQNGWCPGDSWIVETTLGRVMFNELLPPGYPFRNEQMHKKVQAAIIDDLAQRYPMVAVAQTLDKLKDAGFYWATRSGVTVSMADVLVPPDKQEILDRSATDAEGIERKYQRGTLTHRERDRALVTIWQTAADEIATALAAHLPHDNPFRVLIDSGAAGNLLQLQALAGMKGVVTSPAGEVITRPITSSFRQGLTVPEYLINVRGGRKGLADSSLGAAAAGFLSRRLIDVAHDVVVREKDCGTQRCITIAIGDRYADGSWRRGAHVDMTAAGRTLADNGADLSDEAIGALLAAGITEVKARSVLTCASANGVCAHCYGRSMATGKLVDIGDAVGIVAAQSISEPGTQLTLRSFHGGGVTAEGITGGLPRVEQLLEARPPGVGLREQLRVQGAVDTGRYLVDAVQQIYRSQGVSIHDKHIEVIVRQMLRFVSVLDSGTTALLPGTVVERHKFQTQNREVIAEGGEPATGRTLLLGITKASLNSDSWLSAASFRETTRVLTDAALHVRIDWLSGVKENMIVGRLIPAGTGLRTLST
jgi:DNA-directed RNA polymerase subunit beta'